MVKSLVAALADVNIDGLLKQSAAATTAPSAPAKEEKKEEALTGLSALWMTSVPTL